MSLKQYTLLLSKLLKQCFAKLTVHRNHLENLLKFIFWYSQSRVEPKILHFWQASSWLQCCLFLDHTFVSKVLSTISVITTQSSKVLPLDPQNQELVFFRWGGIQSCVWLWWLQSICLFIQFGSFYRTRSYHLRWSLAAYSYFHPYWKIRKHYLFEYCSILYIPF